MAESPTWSIRADDRRDTIVRAMADSRGIDKSTMIHRLLDYAIANRALTCLHPPEDRDGTRPPTDTDPSGYCLRCGRDFSVPAPQEGF